MSRIEPLAPSDWPEEMNGAIAALRPANPTHEFPKRRKDRPKGLNILGTLAQHPRLAAAYHSFNGHVQFATTLALRERELLILRVAARRSCDYEWAQHSVIAGDVGLTSDEIERVLGGPDAPGWGAHDSAMLRAVDELIANAKISDDTWAELAVGFDDQQLMDLIFTVGAYDTLAMLMRSVEMELDDDLRPSAPGVAE